MSKTKAGDFYVPSLCLQPTKKSNLVLSSSVPSKRKKRDNTVPSSPVPSKQKKRDNLHNQRKELLKRIITSSREKQVTKEIMISKSVVINSDDCEKCQSGLWIPDLNLFGEDKEILLSDSWLNDRLINAAQKLLQAAFPHIPGFQ